MNDPLIEQAIIARSTEDGPMDNRRGSERTPPEPDRTVVVRYSGGDDQYEASVVNQSRGGLGICLSQPDPPTVGMTVAVEDMGVSRPAMVRWVLWKRDEGWRIGLSWLEG